MSGLKTEHVEFPSDLTTAFPSNISGGDWSIVGDAGGTSNRLLTWDRVNAMFPGFETILGVHLNIIIDAGDIATVVINVKCLGIPQSLVATQDSGTGFQFGSHSPIFQSIKLEKVIDKNLFEHWNVEFSGPLHMFALKLALSTHD